MVMVVQCSSAFQSPILPGVGRRLGYNAIQSEGAVRLAATLRVNGTLSSVRCVTPI